MARPLLVDRKSGDERFVPIFPELRPYLLEVFEQAEEGTEYAITRYRDKNANLRTQLQRIVRKAGLTLWPRLFHNLCATRQTELAEHSPPTSFVLGSGIPRAQSEAVSVGNDQDSGNDTSETPSVLPSDSDQSRSLPNNQVAATRYDTVGTDPVGAAFCLVARRRFQ